MLDFINFIIELFKTLIQFIIDSANYIVHSIQFIIRFPITIMDTILKLDLPQFFIYGLTTLVILTIIIIIFKIISWIN